MCGSEGMLFKTDVEGSIMNVCRECSRYGKVLEQIRPRAEEQRKEKRPFKKQDTEKELLQIIVPDYAKRIKEKREYLGLKQEDFAKKINEKESLLKQVESGHLEPNLALARKLEKALKITLVESHEEVHSKAPKSKRDSFTIGDFIKIK